MTSVDETEINALVEVIGMDGALVPSAVEMEGSLSGAYDGLLPGSTGVMSGTLVESHESLGLLEAAKENNIHLLCFTPHHTHELCPLDRSS